MATNPSRIAPAPQVAGLGLMPAPTTGGGKPAPTPMQASGISGTATGGMNQGQTPTGGSPASFTMPNQQQIQDYMKANNIAGDAVVDRDAIVNRMYSEFVSGKPVGVAPGTNPAQAAQDAMQGALTSGTAIGGGENLGSGLTGSAISAMTPEQARRLAAGESDVSVFGPGGVPRSGPVKNAMSLSPGPTGSTPVNPGAPTPAPTPAPAVMPPLPSGPPTFSLPPGSPGTPDYIGTSPNTSDGTGGVNPTLVTGSGGQGLIATTAATAPGVQAPTASATGYNATTATAAPGVQAGNAQAGLVQATDWQDDPGQVVANRVRDILAEDSPLMQQAQTRALQQQNARGTRNSSMAIGAAQAAMIDAALPIAQQDAQTSAQRAQFNAGNRTEVSKANAQLFTDVSKFNVENALKAGVINQEQANAIAQFNASQVNRASEFTAASANDMAKFNADALLKAGIINQEQANAMSRFNAEQANELAKFELQNDTDIAKFNASESNAIKKLALDSGTRVELANIEAGYKTLMQANASAGDLYKQMLLNITNIMSNPNMDGEAKRIAAQQQMNLLNNGLGVIGTMTNLDLGDLLTWGDVDAPAPGAPAPAPAAPAPAPGGLINQPQPDYGGSGP